MIKVGQGLLGNEELKEVKEAFEYGYFGHAYKVEEFEKSVAEALGIEKECVAAVNTGTTALHIALVAAGISIGDEVLVPSLTFVATYQAVSALGAIPVSCEVYESSLLLDLEDAENKITGKTKAIIPVHYCGNPCNMDKLCEIKEKYDIRIIEDSAHIFKGTYHGKTIGSFGDITCFSFDSLKIISCGEGGAVVSQDKEFINLVKIKRALGMDRQKYIEDWENRGGTYDVCTQGYRYHMSNINAAIGLAQIKKADQFIARRREICKMYLTGLSGTIGIEFLDIQYSDITPFMFVIKVKNGKRNELMEHLKLNEIESGIKYIPAHLFSKYSNNKDNLPVTEKVFSEILELPLHCRLTNKDVEKVIATVKNFKW